MKIYQIKINEQHTNIAFSSLELATNYKAQIENAKHNHVISLEVTYDVNTPIIKEVSLTIPLKKVEIVCLELFSVLPL